MKISSILICTILATFALGAEVTEKPVQVVASTSDMADFASQIGGDRVEVHAITKGQYDLHFFEPRPSEVMKLKRADMLIVAGMELDAFIPGLIDASRNSEIKHGAAGFVDPSRGVLAMDVPTERIDGRMGDVHPYGNPHFWLTPENVRIACSNITVGLIRVSPSDEDYFREREAQYVAQLDATYTRLKKRLAPYKGTSVLQFHPSWDYFCRTFGLNIEASIEPKPGLAPSASHLGKLVRVIREQDVRIALVEPFYPDRPLRFLRSNTGIKTLRLPLYLGGARDKKTYLENLEFMVGEIETALRE